MSALFQSQGGVASAVDRLTDNGYHTVLIRPCGKEPVFRGWERRSAGSAAFASYEKRRKATPNVGIGLDGLVMIDVDADDAATADKIRRLAVVMLGETPLTRFGRKPRLALIYRPAPGERVDCFKREDVSLEVYSGAGRQAVAFGTHPCGERYEWEGESPLDIAADQIPTVTAEQVCQLVAMAEAMERPKRVPQTGQAAERDCPRTRPVALQEASRGESGRVVDGREGFLTALAWTEYRAVVASGRPFDPAALVWRIWTRFQAEADLTRPKGSGRGNWSVQDVQAKVNRLVRSPDKARQAQAAGAAAKFWTFPRKTLLADMVRAAAGIAPAVAAVAVAMLECTRDARGICNASSQTLAEMTGLNPVTVRRARSELIERGFFILKERGYRMSGRKPGKATVVTPNAALVMECENSFPEGSKPRATGSLFGKAQPIEVKDKNGRPVAFTVTEYLYRTPVGLTQPVGHPDPSGIGASLRSHRLSLGLSQAAFGALLGVPQRDISLVERGRRELRPDQLACALRIFNAHPVTAVA